MQRPQLPCCPGVGSSSSMIRLSHKQQRSGENLCVWCVYVHGLADGRKCWNNWMPLRSLMRNRMMRWTSGSFRRPSLQLYSFLRIHLASSNCNSCRPHHRHLSLHLELWQRNSEGSSSFKAKEGSHSSSTQEQIGRLRRISPANASLYCWLLELHDFPASVLREEMAKRKTSLS